jgi:GNAT superfamily N-acetyltransferase
MSISYRMAAAGDEVALAELRWCLCHEDCAEDGDKAQFVADFCRLLPAIESTAQVVHWMAWHEERAIAAMTVVRVVKMPAPDDLCGEWGYLTNVYTLPEFRGRGVGAALLAAVTGWARQTRLELLLVWPSERSVPFYGRAGFQRGTDPLVLVLPADRQEEV